MPVPFPSNIKVNTIHANIGAGKTTIMKLMEAKLNDSDKNVMFIYENVEDWIPFLEIFYNTMQYDITNKNEISRLAVSLQLEILSHYNRMYHKIMAFYKQNDERDLIVVIERSPMDVTKVFLTANVETYSKEDLNYLLGISKRLEQDPIWADRSSHFIRVSVDDCKKRIDKRDRKGESSITKEYLEVLDKKYEFLLKESINDPKATVFIHKNSDEKQYECADYLIKIIFP